MIHQRHRQMDRRMDGQITCDSKIALYTVVHHAVKTRDVSTCPNMGCSFLYFQCNLPNAVRNIFV